LMEPVAVLAAMVCAGVRVGEGQGERTLRQVEGLLVTSGITLGDGQAEQGLGPALLWYRAARKGLRACRRQVVAGSKISPWPPGLGRCPVHRAALMDARELWMFSTASSRRPVRCTPGRTGEDGSRPVRRGVIARGGPAMMRCWSARRVSPTYQARPDMVEYRVACASRSRCVGRAEPGLGHPPEFGIVALVEQVAADRVGQW